MFTLVEHVHQLADPTNEYSFNDTDISALDENETVLQLNNVVDSLSSDSSLISDEDVFDMTRSFIKYFDALRVQTIQKLLDSLLSGFTTEIDATTRDSNQADHTAYRSHKDALERYAFLTQWFIMMAEKCDVNTKAGAATANATGKTKKAKGKQSKDDFVWEAVIPEVLAILLKALKLHTERVWQTTAERDTFISCFMKPVNLLAESESHIKSQDIRQGIFRVFCVCAKNHAQVLNTQMTVLQNLQYSEHLSEPMAELVCMLAKEYDFPQLGEEVLKEIADKNFSGQDTKGPRSFSRFLIKTAELYPRLVLKQIVVLQRHLDSESYPMRNALVDILGILIHELSTTEQGDTDPEVIKKQIEGFFELLFERFLDLNSYVRARVVAVLTKTCDLPVKFPQIRYKLVDLTLRSLQDKSSQVRKNCIALLRTLILTHPYGRMHGGELNIEEWEERDSKLGEELKVLDLPNTQEEEAMDLAKQLMDDEPMSVDEKPENNRKTGRRSEAMDLAAADQSQMLASVDDDTLTRLRLTKKYYSDAVAFIKQLDRGSEDICKLVASTVKSEVLEAMEFFKIAKGYKLQSAEDGVKKMLHLIWSKDEVTTEEDGKEIKGVRSKLIEVYYQLYIEPVADLAPKDQVARVTRNLIEFTRDSTLAELTSLEALLGVMMSKGMIEDDVISKLWQVYSTHKDIPKFQRRGAILILGMCAIPRPEVVADQVETLLKIGLGSLGKADLVLAKYTCTALNRLSGSVKKIKGSLEDGSSRLPMDSSVFSKLKVLVLNPSRKKEWFSMAEQAVNTIYGLGDQPDALCSLILRELTERVFAKEQAPPPSESDPEAMAVDEPASMYGNAFELSQLMFLAGHCAVKQIVHLELVERDIKRRKADEDKAKGPKKDGGDELDQVVGSLEDDVGDLIGLAKEKELLYGPDSILAILAPMAATIVSQPKIYRNPMLQTAATLALSKFMCVSARFCEEHLMVLFKVFESSTEDAVRSNIVIALGDIAVCFSNIMDENSDRLYQGLHDRNITVKKNTLMVLTHLILNGMIKVKGQLGEMAKCLSDKDKRMSDLAHLFFTELSTKEKAIYNNLPDIISHLSSGTAPVDDETFATSMKFIFTFIDKKREAETVVEKLCQRFQMADSVRQWRDIAYCLSLLPFNSENAVKKLVEGLPLYQDKLHDEIVFKRFQEILTKARNNKVSKNEADLKEFEDALEEHRAKGNEEQEVQKKVQKSKKRGAKASKPAKFVATKSTRRQFSRSPPTSP